MPRVLIVDDDRTDQDLARRSLRPLSEIQERFASDGEEALAALSRETVDLVLTDLRMPGIDGLELVRRIRETYPTLPVILMTSQGNERIAVAALRAGAASYVPKSDLRKTLADTVEQVLEVAGAQRSRAVVLRFLTKSESEFTLDNDPSLIAPFVGLLQENLERIGFGDGTARTQIGIAVMEAVANAMIHGNLEVSSEVRRNDWNAHQRLVEERRQAEPYASRRVRCEAREAPDLVTYVIRDEGPGFDVRRLPDPTRAENVLEVSGRGVMLMRTFMDEVAFDGRGNTVTLKRAARR